MLATLEFHSCGALAVGTAAVEGGRRLVAAFWQGVGAHHTGDELNLSQRLSCMHRHVFVERSSRFTPRTEFYNVW